MSNEQNISKVKMHATADGQLFEYARTLRKEMTQAETVLWKCIRNKKLGVKFRRQHPMDAYILDFYCHELKLGIEVDGSIHEYADNKLYDAYRTIQLKEYEVKIIRFKNEEVLNDLKEVVERIKNLIPSLSRGEGS
jgi:very-short-patch-repair endonuclease